MSTGRIRGIAKKIRECVWRSSVLSTAHLGDIDLVKSRFQIFLLERWTKQQQFDAQYHIVINNINC